MVAFKGALNKFGKFYRKRLVAKLKKEKLKKGKIICKVFPNVRISPELRRRRGL
jgi:hypothetical protein